MNYIFGLIGVMLSISSVLAVLFYIINALSYYTISKNRGYNKPWLAWIPVACDYLKGAVVDDINRRKGKATSFRIWLLILGIVVAVSGVIIGIISAVIGISTIFSSGLISGMDGIPHFYNGGAFRGSFSPNDSLSLLFMLSPLVSILLNLVAIAYSVIMYIVLYKTFEDYVPQNAVVFLLLSIFVSITYPFLLFSIRNKPAVSIYGAPYTAPKWNWTPPQQPYGTTPPPVYGQVNAVPPTADSQENNWQSSNEPPKDGQGKPQQ